MDKKKKISLVVLIIGLIMLVAGLVFLILNLVSKPAVADGEYLISAKEWRLDDNSNCANSAPQDENSANCEGDSGVIWKFTEVGKGTLTTNNHANDYDFIWALEDKDLLKIETKWLYDMDNVYNYKLDKDKGVLTLTADGQEYTLTATFDNTK